MKVAFEERIGGTRSLHLAALASQSSCAVAQPIDKILESHNSVRNPGGVHVSFNLMQYFIHKGALCF